MISELAFFLFALVLASVPGIAIGLQLRSLNDEREIQSLKIEISKHMLNGSVGEAPVVASSRTDRLKQ
jgi:hypothetical protein